MALPNSGIIIPRRSIAGMEGMWAKMWDPPKESPGTPELLTPTNPVPAFMESLGLGDVKVPNTVQLALTEGITITGWNGAPLVIMAVGDQDMDASKGGTYPGTILRVPRGVIFHAETQGKTSPPHTIHWHGIEPTPMNDGVGHTSMEIGKYTYQLQPNFIGSYFYHCHRNTVQHFEMGLFGFLIIEPPDAYANPLTAGGYPRRTAASLAAFPQFPGFVAGDLASGDPHAYTVPYDYEALWVCDDMDSYWHNQIGLEARAWYPAILNRPGVDDQFWHGHFHDFNPDNWFITGVVVPNAPGVLGTIPPNVVVPPGLNGGVTGMQVSVNAQRGKTILVRALCASYNSMRVTFPVDVVIIAWDGRALGVPPLARYSHAYRVPAGTPIRYSVARRIDALIRTDTAVNAFATVEFFDTRGENVPGRERIVKTARIPFVIN